MEASAELDMNADVTPPVDDCRFKRTPQQRGVSSRRRLSDSGCRSTRLNSGFKSPVQKSSTVKSAVHPEEEAKELRQTLDRLDSEIAVLDKDGCVEEELDKHIDLLHEYNDIKDIAQTLLGRLVVSINAYGLHSSTLPLILVSYSFHVLGICL
ncbi:DNA repair protein SWI5 homolog isoform X2 [Triplophysa rosa]|uniref:DNA repair protein SWI5 homolog isoform X2 n=1 Tax=Triplophysa rosa TaxID=992332 RepID=UPI002545E298|nr:DNA repair protein SWI5 homolog isoform X2 [Triplophysa rosa]